MIITQDGYDPGDDPAGVPLIGYDNKISSVEASSEDADHPVTNLLNPATHLFWQAAAAGPATLVLSGSGSIDYLALARHNLARVSLRQSSSIDAISGELALLMHFEAANASTNFYDNSGNDVGVGQQGAMTITNAQFKFGATSAAFSGGRLWVGTDPTFTLSGDFTIDFWCRIAATGTIYTFIDSSAETTGFSIRKTAANVLVFRAGGTDRITGATAMTTGTWHHVALTRSGSDIKLFFNGAQQGSTYVAATVYTGGVYTYFGATQANADIFSGHMDELRVVNGRADWTAAFTPPTTAWTDTLTILAGDEYQALFHFDGTDASTTITDASGGHTFTAQGNAQLDTAQFKFGTSSALFDGTGDYLQGDGSSDFAFGTGDFTIDFWVRFNSLAGAQILFDTGPDSAGPLAYVQITKNTPGNVLTLFVNNATRITGGTALTTGAWHHVALTRASGSTRLFLNGVQEGSTYTDANDYQIGTSHPFIGSKGDGTGSALNGWLDELRVLKGTALWTAIFAEPSRAAGSEALAGRSMAVADFSPLMFRFSPTTNYLLLELSNPDDPVEIGVVYAGELLVLERSVKVDVQHTNLYHARQASVLAGMSESGNFLGRVLTSEWRESQAEFAWFTPDWYREFFEPFAEASMTDPFFWVWNPDEYPEEVAFAWITETIRPETDPATRRVAATIGMRGIV
jgi:Concanavalin A-like lectin/glucanases superfamily